MTAQQKIATGALTHDQLQLLHALSGAITPEQARWLSGYFAGLETGLAGVSAAAADLVAVQDSSSARSLTILHAGETGNCARLAGDLKAALEAKGLAPKVADAFKYKPVALKSEEDIVVIASTHGEGDPAETAIGLFEYLDSRKAPKLDGTRFAVLSLGDSTYEFYCAAGRKLDEVLENLGGERLIDRVDCDVDFDDPAAAWIAALAEKLGNETSDMSAASPLPASLSAASSVHDKRNPFSATLVEALQITGRGSTKDTRHLEFDIEGSGLTYEPGDALGVVTRNHPALVADLLAATGLDGAQNVTVGGETLPLAQALERAYEISAATPRFIEAWAALSGSEELAALTAKDKAGERIAFLEAHNVIDIVRKFPTEGPDAATFVAGLRGLQPRLYSIASSLSAAPDEVHVTLAPVRYDLHDTARTGVASGYLADRIEPGAEVPVYIQPNPHFRLPADDVPVIMIGAGTGVAPYRAFLQEREERSAQGRNWLLFGERNFKSDFLYQTEWQTWHEDGLLTRLDVAFSRDGAEKVYVQHRLAERGADVFAWLEEGAHLYVCGDAEHMAPDVHDALVALVAEHGALSRENAEAYVKDLQSAHRYLRDVY